MSLPMPLPAAIFSNELPKMMENSKIDIPSNSMTKISDGKLTMIVFTNVLSVGMYRMMRNIRTMANKLPTNIL
jgi:hypothetical protein